MKRTLEHQKAIPIKKPSEEDYMDFFDRFFDPSDKMMEFSLK